MLTLEGLIVVISLCLTAFGLGYTIGCNHAKNNRSSLANRTVIFLTNHYVG
jgi:hypothetical protein